MVFSHHHYPPLGRPGDSASIELHVEALDVPHSRLPAIGRNLCNVGALSDDARLALPSVQARLIMAVAHSQLANHACLYGEAPLRELLDVLQLCSKYAREFIGGS